MRDILPLVSRRDRNVGHKDSIPRKNFFPKEQLTHQSPEKKIILLPDDFP